MCPTRTQRERADATAHFTRAPQMRSIWSVVLWGLIWSQLHTSWLTIPPATKSNIAHLETPQQTTTPLILRPGNIYPMHEHEKRKPTRTPTPTPRPRPTLKTFKTCKRSHTIFNILSIFATPQDGFEHRQRGHTLREDCHPGRPRGPHLQRRPSTTTPPPRPMTTFVSLQLPLPPKPRLSRPLICPATSRISHHHSHLTGGLCHYMPHLLSNKQGQTRRPEPLLLLKQLCRQTAHLPKHWKHMAQWRETRRNQDGRTPKQPQYVTTYLKTGTSNQDKRKKHWLQLNS